MYTPIPISNRTATASAASSNNNTAPNSGNVSPSNGPGTANGHPAALDSFGIALTDRPYNPTPSNSNNNGGNNNTRFSALLNSFGGRQQSPPNAAANMNNPFRNSNNNTPTTTNQQVGLIGAESLNQLPISITVNSNNNADANPADNLVSLEDPVAQTVNRHISTLIDSYGAGPMPTSYEGGSSHRGPGASAAASAAVAAADVDREGYFSTTGRHETAGLDPASGGTTILKNLKHYVYAADEPNAARTLELNLPDGFELPPPLPANELKKRKDRHGLFSIRLTPFIDTVATSNQGLFFEPIIRAAGPGSQLVIGRYTERVRDTISKVQEQYHPVVFKSKVISRAHGIFKVDDQGNWFIRDVKSSSGTFLNHQRLSPASTLSRDFILHDADILQLGMDFRGGTEEIYRCVKMRVELNKSWKRKANAFNKEALKRIKHLQKISNGGVEQEEEDCSICLSKIKPCQAIFISPCSHSWHFHCVRRLVMLSYPQFVCPNCRSACDLEATLESSDEDDDDDEDNNDEQQQQKRTDHSEFIDPYQEINLSSDDADFAMH
ncbi:ubiquitin-conjugating protein DMA1 KNAG_0H03510 [Huiozyma naganishii CBS 8797]|uniref:RING-type E3 ubiquitin transferase n=1 Tax=Huiozyma naganishii (strain ATCC MYA-139 / BCRC 22969 / CBS 8797 / KCTC 17520 / NBRC 10181 / NCYC 3082 / Yp74L-3) TaxID=1071383 RepID=J7RA62_HUIN7|nr:hypothetical protein KNAG_0H03510 [Kazachstania naganishii CBS 8797]CCK71765.1 hypothetical protein KNAG_0H03510 [Kazachstania naganishii CBS 8797]